MGSGTKRSVRERESGSAGCFPRTKERENACVKGGKGMYCGDYFKDSRISEGFACF
jgi:hypothetical protein